VRVDVRRRGVRSPVPSESELLVGMDGNLTELCIEEGGYGRTFVTGLKKRTLAVSTNPAFSGNMPRSWVWQKALCLLHSDRRSHK